MSPCISINKNKGTLTFIGIAGDGMEYRYEIQKRDIKPDEIKILLKLERGDILRFESLETGKEKNKIRIPRFRIYILAIFTSLVIKFSRNQNPIAPRLPCLVINSRPNHTPVPLCISVSVSIK